MEDREHVKKRKSRLCKVCNVDRAFHETKSRRLRLKLEHSQLRVTQLEAEISRLRETIRIGQWQATSSVRPRHPMPTLPNELWREVFRLATFIDGPAFSIPNGASSCREWSLSSTTRRSIPLVCRQWHTVGLEFLYERIVIQDPEQLHSLCDSLDHLEGRRLYDTLRWIRGVEIVLGPVLWDMALTLYRIQEFFITRLPQDQLTLLGFDLLNLEAYFDRSWETVFYETLEPIVPNILRRQTSLRTLSFPAVTKRVSLRVLLGGAEEDNVKKTPLQLPHLQDLFLINGRWLERKYRSFDLSPFASLQPLFCTLRFVALEWTTARQMAEQWLVLLSSAPLLEEVFIGQSGSQRFMDGGFISLLHAVPCLKRLTVVTTTEEMGSLSSPFEDTLVHDYLEMFTIIMDDTDNAKVIRIFSQLFSKIRHRQLPAMRKVVVQSPLFEEGCLDARLILPKEFTDHWVGAIESCADANVQFVNHKGDPIHLWHDRHDIKWRDALIESPKLPRAEEETNQVIRDGDEEEAMECGSDESMDSDSEWYPVADTGWKYHSESDERISDDSEDEAYRYRFQPDLEPIDLDEDSEPERLHYVAMN